MFNLTNSWSPTTLNLFLLSQSSVRQWAEAEAVGCVERAAKHAVCTAVKPSLTPTGIYCMIRMINPLILLIKHNSPTVQIDKTERQNG